MVGLTIGPVYRFRVTEIPGQPGLEIFPTVELIDRLYPPPGQALRFPVPIELTQDELLMAAEGRVHHAGDLSRRSRSRPGDCS